MPHLSKRRKRITENASASTIAEADGVWHSTAIEEADIEREEETFTAPVVKPVKEQSSKKKSGPSFGSSKGDNKKGAGSNGRPPKKDFRRDESSRISPSPIVIHPPSGHAFFSGVLQKCGYIIRQPNANNEMFYDAMMFRKKLSDWLGENDDEMSRIETEASKFLKALNDYLSDKPSFVCSLKPTKHETELIQPSLLHCLLGIDILQPHVLKIVMPVLGEASFSLLEEDVGFVNTILNQLKWLPMIVEGQKFAENLLTIIDTAVFTCQCQMIKLISDIIPSNLHPKIAEKLLDKFSEDRLELNIALMDCFSSLDIPEGFWSNIRNTAIDQMTSADLKDIPAYFSFLFRVESSVALADVITTIREKVALIPKDKSPRNDAYQVEILEKVGFCIAVNPAIVSIWTKQVKDDIRDHVTVDMKTIDLIMLLVFADSHKAATTVLKSMFAEKKLVLRLFSEMMEHNIPMVYQLFSTISKFMDSLLRSRDAKCLDAVSDITVKLFLGLSALEAQALMGNITTILVNYPPSRDVALEILSKLSEQNPKKLLLFAPYLMGVLEYVMQFPARQIRSLMNVLAILSQTEGRNPGESNHFSDEFSILLRKQLTHSDIKIRCFGVFGALATIRQFAIQKDPNEARIKELLKLAWNFVERDEDACGIFFDELSNCVSHIPLDICRNFRDTLKEKFENLWTIDQCSQSQFIQYGQRKSLNLDMTYDANKECSQDRLVVIFENKAMQMSPLVVPALLRVLAFLETKVESGELIGIDAILGCPILFPKLEYYQSSSIADFTYNQRVHLGQYLVLAINFFRESVCAFVADSDPELRVKIWLRLENILQLQKFLVSHFDYFPSLPLAYVAEKTIGSKDKDGAGPSGFNWKMKEAKVVKPSTRKGKGTKKSSKKKARREVSDSESDDDEETSVLVTKKVTSKVNLDEDIQPKKILPHLRRFDSKVFQLLRCPLNCEPTDPEKRDFSRLLSDLSCVSQNPNLIKEVEKFNPDSLSLLLLELKNQASDERCKLDILSVKKLLKYVCKHINSIIEYKEELESESEAVTTTDHQKKLECCLRFLINIMASHFEAIKKLEKDGKEAEIEKSLESLARLINNSDEGAPSQLEITASVASYLGGLQVTIKDPATALDHMKLLHIIHDLRDGHATMKKAIDDVASHYLKCDWKLSSAQVDGFLKIWLSTTPSSIKVIKYLVSKLMTYETDTELDISEVEQKLPNSAVFKSCTATNFHTWYNVLVQALAQYVHKNLRRRGDFEDSIEQWAAAVDIFKELVAVTKKVQKNLILVSLLKHCRMFLDAFISGGAELLPEYWKREKELAQTFCKGLQVPCRTIQHICEHSKKNTDMQLMKSVPLVKRVLETLVFRVREVLGGQGAANAFWMGNLKHRDLHGDCINSQIIEENDIDLISSSDADSDIDEALLSGRNEQLGGSAHFDESSNDVDLLQASGDEVD